ncbi:putative vps9 domain protein [Botrytis fragariae]|uniref:Putative vps9 domain protein n=1 Tax=Botrytis fragariae TaxID=1964551 RepID=A0A8H6AMD4_9HELO|nr:putative vps9 domain protein [Botrytis fragariae]KAF5869915.1 putative vps9 domain protein [Botrytis fragariae]
MQPLNPFLSAFFKSALPTQCTPVHHHILLVPTTEVLLTSRDRETGALYADLAGSEDFLGSHVLRVPANHAATAGGKDAPNMRENRGKAKQYTTVNGRTVVIKDAFVYSNKGFKTLNQAQLLSDTLWYPDSLEPRQWLVYYISRPLVGIFEEIKITTAMLATRLTDGRPIIPARSSSMPDSASMNGLPRKKDIKSFSDLLTNFPMIARQMQPGLEALFKEFNQVFEKQLPPPPSAANIPDPVPDGPIATAMKKARSSSFSTPGQPNGHVQRYIVDFYTEDDENVMRGALETAVTSAIDLFQMVDKQQLSLLGATTDLTGPIVERLIDRYVTEQLHDTILFPRLCTMKRPEDLELESKIRQMEFVDISQVGIPIQGGHQGKHELTLRLGRAVEEFRKLNGAGSPQQMMDILLVTLKTVTQLIEIPTSIGGPPSPEKVSSVLTINADTLVSLLLVVVIRAQVRYLQARLLYMRHFIFVDDVESGEMGYALSTFEAVLSYLVRDSGGLRKASRRNHKLWAATKKGNLKEMMKIMEPERELSSDEEESDHEEAVVDDIIDENRPWNTSNGHARRRSSGVATRLSEASTLTHVFPWQYSHDGADEERLPPLRRPKTVTMDVRSLSSNSEMSFRSRATTIDSTSSGIEGDTSIERLSQTEDSSGESVLMMAVQHERPESLRYLLSLQYYFPLRSVLEDTNNEGTTLLSAAVQLGHTELINIILDFVYRASSELIVVGYLSRQDINGRSVAHFLFNYPELISRVGRLLPWRQKDKNGQTPLFALCRSYDHGRYRPMVEAALAAATTSQGDNQPLHLDDHVDLKGNTLLHIVNDPQVALQLLSHCDSDVNATNEKKFTPLMVASKYGRLEMVRALFSDPRVDLFAKELRGLTAVELAKDDDVRNRIDDLILFSGLPATDGRITAVVRSFFVEDATIRLVLKSGAPSGPQNFTVTTCRRSLSDFEHLAKLLALENPASWLPSISGMRSPFQFPSRPSRAVLRDIQIHLDAFLKILLAHTTFSTHEMLWEFFLVPDIQAEMMEQRSKLKAEARVETVREEYQPIGDVRDVEQFVDHARDMVRSVNYSTKSVARRANMVATVTMDLYDAYKLSTRAISTLTFIPQTHISALEAYTQTLAPLSTSPYSTFHTTVLSIHSTIIAMLLSLSRPTSLISSITTSRKSIERSYNSLSRSTRWPLGLLDETRQRLNEEKEDKVRRTKEEVEETGRELRYTQQVVAAELAGWQDLHEKMGRKAVKDLAQSMLVRERTTLEGLRRAVRRLKVGERRVAEVVMEESEDEEEGGEVVASGSHIESVTL